MNPSQRFCDSRASTTTLVNRAWCCFFHTQHNHTVTQQHMLREIVSGLNISQFRPVHIPTQKLWQRIRETASLSRKYKYWMELAGVLWAATASFLFPLKNKQGNLSACEWVCGWERKEGRKKERKAQIRRERGIDRDKERGDREGIGGI